MYRLLPAMAVAIMVLQSCNKDASVAPGQTTGRVKTEVITSTSGTMVDSVRYVYDTLGRLLSLKTDTVTTDYVYSSGLVTVTTYLQASIFITTYSTDVNGRAVSNSKGFTYRYDSAGYLIAKVHRTATALDSTAYTVSSGNVIASIQYQTDAATNNVITTTSIYLNITDSRQYGQPLTGNASTNLLSTQAITQVLNGNTYNINYTYSYNYDALGRVATQVQNNGSATYTTVYTYY